MMESEKKQVINQFSRTAEQYVSSSSHAHGSDLQTLVEWLQPESNWIALDIATGGGHVTKALSPHLHHMIATDLTPRMLTVASEFLKKCGVHNVSYVIADAEQLPFLDASFDLVTCRIAAHHFPNPGLFIKEAARILRPNGIFLLIDNVSPTQESFANFINKVEKMRDESHVRCLSMQEWSNLMKEHALLVQKSSTRKKTYVFPEWVKRTVKSEQQIHAVENFILQASKEVSDYFHICIENEHVVSLDVDEWMVMCKK